MKRFLSLKREHVSYALVLSFGLLLSAMAASAATSISSTALTAGGTLSVTGISTLTGNVGIGSSTPGYPLSVVGSGYFSGGTVTAASVLATSTFAVGDSNANTVAEILTGTCNLTGTVAGVQLLATSTGQFFCTVTGVAANDKVFVSLTNGHASVWGGFVVVDAFATTTNRIGVTLLNDTGVATSSYILATTSVQYWIVR
jgi:hypothetical protein